MKTAFAIAATLMTLCFVTAAMGDTKPAKLHSCTNFNIATTTDGAKIGICGATKTGGKATFLRSFQVVKVVNPGTNAAESVMVGYQ